MNDRFVLIARRQKLRSRSAFKLLEIQNKYKLFERDSIVLDIGSAPGGWAQIISRIVTGRLGKILAIDKIDLAPLPRVKLIKSDIFDAGIFKEIDQNIDHRLIDAVVSDASPNISGISFVDHINSISLALRSLEIALKVTGPGASFLAKVFRGPHDPFIFEQLKIFFNRVDRFKPDSSRMESGEIYIIAKGRK